MIIRLQFNRLCTLTKKLLTLHKVKHRIRTAQAVNKHLSLIFSWISHGVSFFNRTPLHCAAANNAMELARFLIEHGACIFAATSLEKKTPLQCCERGLPGYFNCMRYLNGKELSRRVTTFIVYTMKRLLNTVVKLKSNQTLSLRSKLTNQNSKTEEFVSGEKGEKHVTGSKRGKACNR